MRSTLIGAQKAANRGKSHSCQPMCQEHDDRKVCCNSGIEDVRPYSHWSLNISLLFVAGYAAFRRLSLCCSLIQICLEQPQPVHTPQRSTARKANFLSAQDKVNNIYTFLGEYLSFEAQGALL